MASRELSRRAVGERARERLGALAQPRVEPVPAAPLASEPGTSAPSAQTPHEPAPRDRGLDPDADDLVARLRSGALSAAATAYTAAHGHPLEHPDPLHDSPRPRWSLDRRAGVVVGLVLLAVALVVVWRGWGAAPADVVPLGAPGSPGGPAATARAGAPSDPFAADPAEGGDGRILVHVVGAVRAPGVVELGAGARVGEAVDAAGGASKKADLGALNLARPVEDGEQVVVPTEGETVPAADGPPADPRVDLNAADAAALETLPGIGPVLAERIVGWRTEHGRFSTVAELQEVAGIGPRLFAQLEGLVRV